ncbi:hypothetical protein CYMTET_50303 [Cymbomonas tetramitiformis]|uniref:Rab-like protein 6 n=1 Tax=Cymbomonas tetramitiformis TaxID=36881 RepID=A0AAE0BQ15_9CHLO|nr:hypothetical protein CYMTET_50303 [Cymbomonas tetramitiformis]
MKREGIACSSTTAMSEKEVTSPPKTPDAEKTPDQEPKRRGSAWLPWRRGKAEKGENGPGTNPNIKLDIETNRKFGKGADYNLKILIRGDRNVGKTVLLRRLRGGTFQEEYVPTEEISTAHINWQAKGFPEDRVKLEVWDVVDKSPPKKYNDALKINGSENSLSAQMRKTSTYMSRQEVASTKQAAHSVQPLDAQAVDVYRGCHAVLFVVDPSKKWTYEYVHREMPRVPVHIPVGICLNFRDYPVSQRVVTIDEAMNDCMFRWDDRDYNPCALETSLLNCYGLGDLYTFLHYPYFLEKQATLEQALTLNKKQLGGLSKTMAAVGKKFADPRAYSSFISGLEAKGIVQAKKEDEDEEAELPAHLQNAGSKAFGGGPPPPPPTKLERTVVAVGEGAKKAGTVALKVGAAVGTAVVNRVAGPEPDPEPEEKPPVALAHLAKSGGVKAHAVGGKALPGDLAKPVIDDSFFADDAKGTKNQQKQQQQASGFGWFKRRNEKVTEAAPTHSTGNFGGNISDNEEEEMEEESEDELVERPVIKGDMGSEESDDEGDFQISRPSSSGVKGASQRRSSLGASPKVPSQGEEHLAPKETEDTRPQPTIDSEALKAMLNPVEAAMQQQIEAETSKKKKSIDKKKGKKGKKDEAKTKKKKKPADDFYDDDSD